MQLIALMSWYDEPLRNLQRSIESLASIGTTHLLAVDGPYAALEGAKPNSAPSQAKHIRKTAMRHDIECVVYQKPEPWHGHEIEKRTFLFTHAAELFEPSTHDWFCVMDADQTIEKPTDMRHVLKHSDVDVYESLVYEHDDKRFNDRTRRRFVRHVFRCLPGLHVGPENHYTYRDGQGRELWGLNEIPAPIAPFILHNYSTTRGSTRRKARETYYENRRDQKLEVNAPTTCIRCGKPWHFSINTVWQVQHLPDGTEELTSNRREHFCLDCYHPVLYAIGKQVDQIAGSDQKAKRIVLDCVHRSVVKRTANRHITRDDVANPVHGAVRV